MRTGPFLPGKGGAKKTRDGYTSVPRPAGKIQFLAACSGATSSLPTMRVRQMKMPRNRAAATMPTG